MGQGVKPHQIKYDKGSALMAGESQELFSNLSKVHFPAATGRARAKSIEPWQKHMNQTVYTWFANKSGANIEAKTLDSKQNPDKLKQNAKSFPSKQEVIDQIHFAFSLWNEMHSRDGRSPAEKQNDPAPNSIALSVQERITSFFVWRKQGKTPLSYRYTAQGLSIEIKGNTYRYLPRHKDAMELATFQNKHTDTTKFYVKYEPTDLSMVGLYILPRGYELKEENLRFLCYANLKEKTKEAVQDNTPAGNALLKKYRDVQTLQGEMADKRIHEIRSKLVSRNILNGAIELKRVHKDAVNRAKVNLQRMEVIGANSGILSDTNSSLARYQDDFTGDIYDEAAVPVYKEQTEQTKDNQLDIYG